MHISMLLDLIFSCKQVLFKLFRKSYLRLMAECRVTVNPNSVCWLLMKLSCYCSLNQQFTSDSDKLSRSRALSLVK